MSRRGFRVVVASVSFVAWIGTATAWAQNETVPENPPANFGPPPPGHEPPPPWTPGDSSGPPPSPAESEIAPGFMTLDRMDAHTRVGIQVGFDKSDFAGLGDSYFLRFNPYAQFILPGTKAGVYGQWAIAHGFIENAPDATGYGNIELGGFFMPLARANDLILRAGLVASTASDSATGEILSNVLTTYERLTDYYLAIPRTTTLRLSGSTIQQIDQFFFRGDAGFDFLIDKPSSDNGPSVVFRANLAAGYRVPEAVDLAIELVNLAAVNGTVSGGITERLIHTAAITARTPGIDQLHIGAVFPLDENVRGDVWILSLGYQRVFY